jgi:Na+/proline symporter
MQLESTKVALAAIWGVALFAAGFAANVTSMLAWSVLGGLAVLPPIVMVRLWNDRPPRVSQRFQEGLR